MLIQSIRNGSVGKWGELPMPAQSKMSDVDLKKLAIWILSIK
jgi:cytochrome c